TQSGDTQIQAIDTNEFTIDLKGRRTFSLGSGRPATGPPITGGIRPSLSRRTLPPANLQLAIAPSDGKEVKISASRLREILPVMREGFGRTQVRLGERSLTNYLQEKGYFFAQVQGQCDPADCSAPNFYGVRVVYDVYPGARYELKKIRILGAF